ncbi:MAG: hypothetical protein V3S00_04785 [Dehalococcoidia bacterium]
MDTDYAIDLEAIFKVISEAEVIVFRFVTVPQRLLFDTRHTEMDGPLLKSIPRATSLEDRFRALKRLRPRFKIPDRITAVWWPKYAGSLKGTGVLERIQRRMAQEGYPQLAEAVEEVLRDLCRQEQAEAQRAITGAGYHTLWERKA